MSPVPRYEDFALGFQADQDDPDRFQVTIRNAPCQGPSGWLRLPFRAEETDRLLAGLEARITGRGPRRHLEPVGTSTAESDPDEIGHRLFQALFQGEVWDCFTRSHERIERRTGTGLRLRLVIDPEAPGGARLASLPWELLYRRETRGRLSLNLWTPVVRFLLTRVTPRPFQGGDTLRVLLVSANPKGSPRLDLREELRRLERALEDGGLEVHHLKDPSIDAGELRAAIRRIEPHVLHFMGHGAFDAETGEGGLLLGGAGESPRIFTAEQVRLDARAGSSLRLVCLNACETGRLPRREGQDPFSGLASSLVMAGVPAVVAMQFPISDRAALTFGTALYRALAGGDPVDAAVTEGRKAIFDEDPRSWEWATPALYLSVPDGRLFSELEDGKARLENDPPTPRSGPLVGEIKGNGTVFVGEKNVFHAVNTGGSRRSDHRGKG